MRAAKVRITEKNWQLMQDLLFSEYPQKEVATFFDCGWQEGNELLVLTVVDLRPPSAGDIQSGVGSIQLNEQYSLRQALTCGQVKFATGLVHSHPESRSVWPSRIDDKMDKYYADYFGSFALDRPFLSMIVSKDESGKINFSGRVFWKGCWLKCIDFQIVGEGNQKISSSVLEKDTIPDEIFERLNRLSGAMGKETAIALWGAKVAIVGGGGTGSALFHSLVRACVGHIVVIDDDTVSISNSERLHGFHHNDVLAEPKHKVDILKRLAESINPKIVVTALKMNANSEEALKHIVECDMIFGCTDSQVGKVLISNISLRYLIPAIHVNVAMETAKGRLQAEIAQVIRYGPGLPCVYCRNLVNIAMLAQELMSEQERESRKQEAKKYTDERKEMYWIDEPVLHTVGSLTTIAAEYAAKVGLGLLSGVYSISESFFEIDILKPCSGGIAVPMRRREGCVCSRDVYGYSGQGEGWLG
jgi:molybdopterin/thiamine biosynthesis adenylyltransferase